MIPTPWDATLSESEYRLISFFLTVAAFALAAGFIRAWVTRGEVGSRYRTAVVARLGVLGVAAVSYILLVIAHKFGYDATADGYVPNAEAVNAFAPRYASWAVTVPLLTVELLAVSALVGAKARRAQLACITGAFLMILAGYLGAFVVDGGGSRGALLFWGGISTLFYLAVNIILIAIVRSSLRHLTETGAQQLLRATLVLLGGWLIFPIVAVIQLTAFGGEWSATMQVAYSIADVTVKLGFATLIHRVAKVRTGEDVRRGLDVHHESVWMSSVKLSDAGAPTEVYLDTQSMAHTRRSRPPTTTAVPAAVDELSSSDLHLPED